MIADMAMKLQPQNNPAGRLLSVIEAIQATPSSQSINKNMTNINVSHGWAQVFGLDKGQFSEILARLAKVCQLPALAEEAINTLPIEDKKLFLEWKPCISHILGVRNLDAPWAHVHGFIKSDQIMSLRHADLQLKAVSSEPLATADNLTEIRDDLIKVLASLLASEEIPLELRNFLVSKVNEMEQALNDYLILGAIPINKIINETIGWIFVHGYDDYFAPKANESALTKFRDAMSLIASILTVREKGTAAVKSVLQWGQDAIE